jgi:hypothetical protein
MQTYILEYALPKSGRSLAKFCTGSRVKAKQVKKHGHAEYR